MPICWPTVKCQCNPCGPHSTCHNNNSGNGVCTNKQAHRHYLQPAEIQANASPTITHTTVHRCRNPSGSSYYAAETPWRLHWTGLASIRARSLRFVTTCGNSQWRRRRGRSSSNSIWMLLAYFVTNAGASLLHPGLLLRAKVVTLTFADHHRLAVGWPAAH